MNKEFAGAGLKGDYIETMSAMHQCLKIRNLFTHCHWTQSKKRGLFFINLEDVAVAASQAKRLSARRSLNARASGRLLLVYV
jgi:hypothetical protein